MTKKYNLLFLLILMVSIFPLCNVNKLYAQSEEEELLKEFEKNLKPSYDKDIQKEFVVIESVTKHEYNPQVTSVSSDNDILANVYEGLFSPHPITLEPQFAIASGYKVSRDKKRWVITIREDAKFSDGTPITANDVRYSWLRLLSTPNAPYASLFDIVRGAEKYRRGKCKEKDVGLYVNDDHTLSIYLNSPANYLPKVLCHTAFSIVSKTTGVYSGAYVISEITNNKTVLQKNPYYWDKNNVAIEKVVFKQVADPKESAYLYNTGKADWIIGNANTNDIIDKNSVILEPSFGVSFFFFKESSNNPSKKRAGSVWDHKEFRNAVLEALPWDVLRSYSFVPASTFVYPLAGYPEVDGFELTDPLEAKVKMLDARKKYNVSVGEILPLTIEIVEGSMPESVKVAVMDALAPIGVEVVFREIRSELYFSNVSKSNADIFNYSWIGDFADPLTFLELFRGNSTFNESGWKNEEYDSLLEKASTVSDEERYKLLAEAENILLNDGMIIPISRTVTLNILDPKEVGGWYPNAFDMHLFRYIYKKEFKPTFDNIVMR